MADDVDDWDEELSRSADLIAQADALVITAGAGLGVDSGLPDFRGDKGFWRAYPPIEKLGLRFVDLAQSRWFLEDPALAWGFYGHRRNLYRSTVPHEGFSILKKWSSRLVADSFVFTSNVDGHFQKAGFAESNLAECHGSLEFMQCAYGCQSTIWQADSEPVDVDESTFRARDPLPQCPNCQRTARPNVLMFYDWAWVSDRTQAQEDRLANWLEERISARIVILEFGAGMTAPTVRRFSENLCRQFRTTLIRVNPRESMGPPGTLSVPLGALPMIQEVDKRLSSS